ncbi:glycosyltransferase family 4 protein [Blastococcus sp. SYSU DS0541]
MPGSREQGDLEGLRIAMVVPGPLDNSGGVELSAQRLLKLLRYLGADCRVVWRQRSHIAASSDDNDLPVVDVRGGKVLNRLLFGWRATRAGLLGSPQVLHIQSLEYAWPLVALLPWQRVRRRTIPVVVVTTHGSLSSLYSKTAFTAWQKLRNAPFVLIFKRIETLAVSRADYVISVSDHAAQDVRRSGYKGRLSVIPNAVDTDTFTPGDGVVENRSLLWTGRAAAYKNPTAAVQIMRSLRGSHPSASLTMVGPDLSCNAPNVSCVGRLSQADLAELLRGAYAFVSTSSYEGDPLAVKEALACGVPVIVTPIASQGVTDGVNGLVVPHAPTSSQGLKAFEGALSRLLSDEALRHRLAEGARAGRESLSPRFEFESYRTIFSQIYSDVASSRTTDQR